MQFPLNVAARPATSVRVAPRVTHGASRKASATLWTIQGALAVVFLFAGVSKLVMPADTLTQDSDLPALFLRFIGVCETFGAVGLVLPGLLRIHRELTPLAAAGLVVIMAGATSITAVSMGIAPAAFPFVVGMLALTVAVKRSPRSSRTILRV